MGNLRFGTFVVRGKAAIPAAAFFGGFAWDAMTLGRVITDLDLFLLLGYILAAGGILVWMGRRGTMGIPLSGPSSAAPAGPDGGAVAPAGGKGPILSANRRKWLLERGPTFALQFLFGSIFSALVIFYFLSSSYLPGFLLVIALVALLILNEFLESEYQRFTLSWTLYGVCCVLFLNFALPHLVRSVNPMWFFISTAAGVAMVFVVKALSRGAKGALWPAMAAAAVLVALFLANAIPPVPIVKKKMIICRNLEKRDGIYTGDIEKGTLASFWRRSESVVRQRPGEKIFCFTSVFLPPGIQTTLYHRWMYDDVRAGAWVEHSRIGFPITGGRSDGFRGFTYKRNLTPGKWEVRVETGTGRVIGVIHFRAEASQDSTMELTKRVLR